MGIEDLFKNPNYVISVSTLFEGERVECRFEIHPSAWEVENLRESIKRDMKAVVMAEIEKKLTFRVEIRNPERDW